MITDNKVDPASLFGERVLPFFLNPALSKTTHCFARHKPGVGFQISDLNVQASAVTAAITLNAYIGSETDGGVITAGALAIDATAEKYDVALRRAIINGVFVEKAAVTAQLFTAAHTITGANKYGAILIQQDNTGVYSSKVVGLGQAYATSALAIAALPAADAGKLRVGYIVIQAKNASWTANTDDLTNGSDVVTAVFVTDAATVVSCLNAVLTPLAGKVVRAVLPANRLLYRGRHDQTVFLTYTTDGAGAMVDGYVTLKIRARPNAGQA